MVEVALNGRRLRLEGAVLPGVARFQVRNVSRDEHSFAIEGEGRRNQLADPLAPGKSGELIVNLVAGSYRIFCPLRGHRAETRQLVVTPRAER